MEQKLELVHSTAPKAATAGRRASSSDPTTLTRSLYTATLVHHYPEQPRMCFYAVIATPEQFWSRLDIWLPGEQENVVASHGLNAGDPVVAALLSNAMIDMLILAGDAPASPLADDLEIFMQMRFAK